MTLTSDVKIRKQEANIIDPNLNNSYIAKKNFTGFYTEVNPRNATGSNLGIPTPSDLGSATNARSYPNLINRLRS